MLIVEKGLAIPKNVIRNKYPYKLMEVGDSFFVPNGKLNQICNGNYRVGKQLGWRFVARSEEGGVRVWRTE